MKSRYVISWAQDRTPVHLDFWKCLKTYAKVRRAKLLVVAGMYKNPTSPHQEQYEDGEWAVETHSHLVDERVTLCPNLVLFADVRIQPTASRPLSSKEVFAGGHSGIFGHSKRALEVVPTATRMPRILATTGACTISNYSTTNAGRKGDAHHVLGALVVDIDAKGLYFIRNVTYDPRTKSFTDLNRRYLADRAEDAPPAESLTLGDIHVGQWSEDGRAERAARALFDLVQPKHLILHDVLDFSTRNHHRRSRRDRYAGAGKLVREEVEAACKWVNETSKWTDTHETHLARSNHCEAAERWMEEFDLDSDPENSPYFHWLSWRSAEVFCQTGKWPNVFAMEYERLYPDEPVHFLKRNEPLRIKNVEHGYHGDHGISGSRGSALGYAKLGCKVNIGHSHSPKILDGVFQSGVYGSLDHGYNDLPSTWVNAHTVLHADGRRQLVMIFGGKFCA